MERQKTAFAVMGTITLMRRTSSRNVGAFPQRDMVGCEHRSCLLSGNRPQGKLEGRVERNQSRSSTSS
jgi:hypothetical protein